jgi:exodeoxyribonuclease-3
MQIATWNVNSLGVRLPQVLDWLEANPVDVLGLQELKLADDKFPAQALAEAGWHAVWHGQKTYNGVALLSRMPMQDVVRNNPHFADEQSRLIAATLPLKTGTLRVINGYFPNGQAPDSDKFAYKMRWLEALRAWLPHELNQHRQLVLMGDMNITMDARDVWDPALEGSIHCTPQEREQLAQIMALGLHDSLRLFTQEPKVYSWWDYRDLAFRRNRGMRIDHLLISEALRPQATACAVDKAPRKNPRPSDHAPVVLTLGRPPAAA